MDMRFCFIGVGSIARRHIRNLCAVLSEEGVTPRIDVVRRKPTLDDLEVRDRINRVYTDCARLADYDAIFITNPTALHIETLCAVRGKAKAYFIEKPVTSADKLEALRDDAYLDAPHCYVACPLRHTRVVRYIKDYAARHKVCGVRAISSSFLPEWRPGQDYRETYSARETLGGGVAIDLIHEWDYLKHVFGMPRRVVRFGGRKSALEIETDDTALYLAEYADMFVELHLDYFGRKTIRECMLFSDDETVVADLANHEIRFLKAGGTLPLPEDRDDFQRAELRHFLRIARGAPSDSTIREAVRTLRLTLGEIVCEETI